MMSFWQWLFALITFPIEWFWNHLEQYKESKNIGKIILLVIVSFSGFLVFIVSFGWLIYYLLNYHMEIVVAVSLIIWIYAYVKMRMDKKAEVTAIQNTADADLYNQTVMQMQAQAEKGYPIMRNIIYQTAKEVAPDIGGVMPRLLQEIEIIGGQHYIWSNGICYYQFKLDKADLKMQYDLNDLLEFRMLFQTVCSRLINAGRFPTLRIQNYMDAWGNWYDAVCIDVIEDVGNAFIIQSVFVSPTYTEYLYQLQMNQQDIRANTSVPDVNWNERL